MLALENTTKNQIIPYWKAFIVQYHPVSYSCNVATVIHINECWIFSTQSAEPTDLSVCFYRHWTAAQRKLWDISDSLPHRS